MVNWIDTIVVTIIIGAGLMIFYKALQEPMDRLFGAIGSGLKWIFEALTGTGDENTDIMINYG